MNIKLAAACAFMTILSACGGGGGSDAPASTSSAAPASSTQPASAPAPAAPPKVAHTVIIETEGDSTMWGDLMLSKTQYELAPITPQMQMQTNLQAKGMKVSVLNGAVSASTLTESLAGLYPYWFPLSKRLEPLHADIVIDNHAIVDVRFETTNQYADLLVQFIETVRATGAIPVLEEPNPVCWKDPFDLDPFVSIMRTVAQQQKVLLIEQYDYIKSLPNWQAMTPDCTHPNQELYQIKGDREAEQLLPLVKSLQ